MTDVVENDILNGTYSLFQQVLYGGVSHGVIVIPTHIIKLFFTLIFPPLGEIINSVSEFIINDFPWVTWDAIKKLFEFKVLNRIIYSFVLTSMFYIPGLIYTLSNLTTNTPNVPGTLICKPEGGCIDASVLDKTTTKAN
jgi:hypothetical protein